MNKEALMWHIGICLVIGSVISYFTSATWLAASFWVSAALFINGSIAYVEDSQTGGFDNPDGTDTPEFVKGWSATKFAISSFLITICLVMVGFLFQEYL